MDGAALSHIARIRTFRWEDLEEWTRLKNAINSATGTERAFDHELARQFLSQATCEPEQNCLFAEVDRSLVGLAQIAPELPISRCVASGGVLESYRGRGIGRALLSAATDRARAVGASVLHVQVPSDSKAGRCLLESAGFKGVRTYWRMTWYGDKVPAPGLASGFGLRSFRTGLDEEALTDLQNAAFGDSWGFCPNTVDEIRARLRFKTNHPDGIILATDGPRLAAYNWTQRALSGSVSTGWISMTGVHPDYRGRGLGKAIVLAGMEVLTGKGVRSIELEIDEQNARAREIYCSVGFRKSGEMLWYEKRLL